LNFPHGRYRGVDMTGFFWRGLGGEMIKVMRIRAGIAALAMVLATASSAQIDEDSATRGWSMEQNRSAPWLFSQHQKLSRALAAVRPQRPGVIDAYLVVVGLDSDPVFQREAAESQKVLERRFGATGRSLLMVAGAGDGTLDAPHGSPANLATAFAAIAAKMDPKEDVLVLYSTSHGDKKLGLVYRDGENGLGVIGPKRLKNLLGGLGINRRILLLSACYTGIFVPELEGKDSVIVTAASASRPSFGCRPGNDWTFFGDALINNALRKPQPFGKAADEARTLISAWESKFQLPASDPQVSIGASAAIWMAALDLRMPKTGTANVGKPAIESSFER
jgi:Peptidase C13 family